MFSSGIIEVLPDAIARAEAQLRLAQRPLCLDWTRFLGVLGLCLEAAYMGTGTVVPSAVARLFEETHDEKLDFLTRKRSRLPPSRKIADTSKGQGGHQVHEPPLGFGRSGDGAREERILFSAGGDRGRVGNGNAVANPAGTASASLSTDGGELSLREAGSTIDTREDGSLGLGIYGSSGGDSGRAAGVHSGTRGGNGRGQLREETSVMTGFEGTAEVGGRWGGEGGGGFEGKRGARGGGTAALKSLLRPQARHEVFRGYGEAVSRRRGRQREAALRAPEPDVEPARAYKPCGLCQAPFPVESLGATVSLKVLGSFLAKAGAPSERFDRKASRLCSLHRLPLCVFCSQFFDPDFPGGIVPAGGYRVKDAKRGACGAGSPARQQLGKSSKRGREESVAGQTSVPCLGDAVANGLVPFFDDRYPERWSHAPLPSSAPADISRRTDNGSTGGGSLRGNHKSSAGLARTTSTDTGSNDMHGARSDQHVPEAKELREVGDLVRGGCSIRDHLIHTRSQA